MKTLKEMTIDELKNYEARLSLCNENAHVIAKMADDFIVSYRGKSKEDNINTIASFEKALDSYEKESKELCFETSFVETQRGLIPVMKKLARID